MPGDLASRGWSEKGSRRTGGLEEMIISLYAGGMTVRDIGHHLERTASTGSGTGEPVRRSTAAIALGHIAPPTVGPRSRG